MSTKKLAKELGLLRQRSQSATGQKKPLLSKQTFSYLIVIDFESTCWREKNNYTQEIIEFPAVLLNTSTGEIESEFHSYVQPQERAVLSAFCTELTGITQTQVEAGVPLRICLSQFARWLQKLRLEKGVAFPARQQSSSAESPEQNLCAFLTWSDWDLGVCLHYECKRKQILKPNALNSWIDLRSTYRTFYSRKPKGLNGALQDLGIQFCGREHSGLDDARNTARLAAKMMSDGCVMKITRSLDGAPSTVKPTMAVTSEKPRGHKDHHSTKNTTTSTGNANLVLNPVDQNSFRSLVSPRTVLDSKTTPPWGIRNSNKNNGLVLCSTIIGGLEPSTSNSENVEEFFVENEDRSTSDDVVLEDSEGPPVSDDPDTPCILKPKSFLVRKRTTTRDTNILSPRRPIARPSGIQNGGVLPATNQKMTSPLCDCGRRAKRLQVSNGGPNQGKAFYCCSGRRSGGAGAAKNKGCRFFKWESALKARWSLSSAHVGAARPARKSTLRKSW
ncbi:ERI1 exoribonuclease 2 [Syngnathoides biaculeatus]|uniref:ERI1 exoribonuclease 2 n=1 Tax=Syngnathoides biaculeatus TaxID=300417 RepID=UPI002ADDABBE|nr:ERI1 exoribonuclease 2 [Syngnathoides biaculeatus]